jgi:hypothetical protein
MTNLQNFIIQEELRADHAERFLIFQERYNDQVLLDLKKALEKEWSKNANVLIKKHKLDIDDVELALIQNSKASVSIDVESKDEKISSSRSREAIEVSPSVKISLLFKQQERDLIIKTFLDAAENSIKHIADQWREIFRVEKQGRAVPWFKIVRDKDEIRFQLALSNGKNEMYRTLYSVRVDYGKLGSKTKDFDRVYLISMI